MSQLLKKLLAVAVTLTLSQLALAQTQSPESAAAEYFMILQSEGFTATGRMVHPTALKEFRDMLEPVFEFTDEIGDTELMDLTFGPGVTMQDLKALSDMEFYNGFMNIMVLQMGSNRLEFDKIDVLGAVQEGEQQHVLARMTANVASVSLTDMEIISLRQHEGLWKVQLNGEIQGLAQALRENILQQ